MIRCVLLFTLLIVCSPARSQQSESASEEKTNLNFAESRVYLSAKLQMGIPIGHLGKNLAGNALGSAASFLIKLKKSTPVYMGLEMGIMSYDQAFIRYYSQVNGFLIELQEETKPSIFMAHTLIRIEWPKDALLQPYFEGMVGFKNMVTRTELRDIALPEDAYFYSNLDRGDWALSYGAAVGLQMPLFIEGLNFNIRCSYLMGSAADYYARRPGFRGVPAEPLDVFELKNSTTDLIQPTVGLSYRFSNSHLTDGEQ